MQNASNLQVEHAKRLQTALTRLAALDQEAERESMHGRVMVEIGYRNGMATHVREVKEATHK